MKKTRGFLFTASIALATVILLFLGCVQYERDNPDDKDGINWNGILTCALKDYNDATQFCSGSSIYEKCGSLDYNPSTEFCDNSVVRLKCGGSSIYSTATQFCSTQDSKVYNKCGGLEYDTSIEGCCNNIRYYISSFINPQGCCNNSIYNSSTQYCSNGTTPKNYGSLTDTRDSKTYRTIEIGTQTWMERNLNYNANGSKCYGDLETFCDSHGRLYNWSTAMSGASSSTANPSGVKGVCPDGWHLPSQAEWEVMTAYIGGAGTEGKKLKSRVGWTNGEFAFGNGTDDYGFSATPGGGYIIGTLKFDGVGSYGYWWSTTEYTTAKAYSRHMDYLNDGATWFFGDDKGNMYSVRCVETQKLKCGNVEYYPDVQTCDNGVVKPLCDGIPYDGTTQFCSEQDTKIYEKCNGSSYNTSTHSCENGIVKSKCDIDNYFCDTRDGQAYRMTTIGTQTWMAENLNYVQNSATDKCYDDNQSNCNIYGRLYNWTTAKAACPDGWHLPSHTEWKTLSSYVESSSDCSNCDAAKLKATSGWSDYEGKSGNGTDDYGFSALPGGGYDSYPISFGGLGYYGHWWSATSESGAGDGWCMYYRYDYSCDGGGAPYYLYSVRCVRDN